MPLFFRTLLRIFSTPALALCLFTLFGLAAPLSVAAATYYVSPIGSDSSAGTLAAPFLTIQHGITTAISGDTVTVEDGTYTGPGNVDLDFGGRNLTVTSQNGTAKTIINCGGTSSANHRGFYIHSGETSAAINGLTIVNGYEGGSSSSGGGIYAANVSINVQNCTVQNCNAAFGGGIAIYGNGLATVTACTLAGNSASNEGGGLYDNNYGAAVITINNCNIYGNRADYGGGIYTQNDDSGTVIMTNCLCTSNTATYYGGGIDESNLSFSGTGTPSLGVLTLSNCLLVSNRALHGGGVADLNYGGTISETNCTLTGNLAATGTNGGGIYAFNFSGGTITLTNEIFFFDTGGEITNDSNNTSNVVANYCDVQGGYAGTGNLNVDPLFVLPPNMGGVANLHLKSSSPCVGAGTATGTPRMDIEGRIRPDPPSIGAYEEGTPVPGSDDFFVVTSENSGSNTIGEYTPTGHYVRTITVPGSTGPDSEYGLELLRGIAATDAGQLVGFNGTLSPNLTTYFPTTLSFTSETAPGWKAGATLSSGSIGVYQGYTFVVNQNALLRFNPNGTSQQFAYNSADPTAYINLAVGMDSKVYALRLNLAGGQTSAWALDVYDPISLAFLRTINLQLPYTQNSQAVDLRNFAVDAQGGIYAIELYDYVYHFDTNGNLLQSASHGQGGYTIDIKIDPFTGNLLISIDSYGGKIIETNPLLSSFQTLVTLDPNQTDEGFITFSNAALAATLIGPPTLTATAGAGSVSLQWTAPEGLSGATYTVSRGTTSGGETLIQSGLTTTSFTDTTVTGGTQYYYTVQAVTAIQTSAVSNEVSVTPTAAILGKVRFFPRVSWESRMVGGQFQGSPDGITWTTLFMVMTKPATAWTEGLVTAADPKTFRFLRYLSPNGGYGNVAEIEFYTGAGASAVKLTGAPLGTPGSYKNLGNTYLKALDSSTTTFFDQGTPDGVFVGFDQTPPPAAPTGLIATGGNAQIMLSWTASPDATRYYLYRGTTPGGEGTRIYKAGLAGTSYVDTSVTAGATYYYVLRAVNSNGGSPASNEAHAATGSLSGSSAAITASQAINLTTLGTADWAHWGLNGVHGSTPGESDHKANLISTYTTIGTGTVVSYPTSLVNCTWTGGTPTASAATSSEVYVNNNGSGFGLTVPADTTRRTLTLYVGGYHSSAMLTAHLSDGSAVDFVDASYGYNKAGSTDGAHYQAVYTLTYSASSAGQRLTVSWVQTSSAASGGNVTLQAAALALTPL